MTTQTLMDSVVAYRSRGNLVVTAPGDLPFDYLIQYLTLTGHIQGKWRWLGSEDLSDGFVKMTFRA